MQYIVFLVLIMAAEIVGGVLALLYRGQVSVGCLGFIKQTNIREMFLNDYQQHMIWLRVHLPTSVRSPLSVVNHLAILFVTLDRSTPDQIDGASVEVWLFAGNKGDASLGLLTATGNIWKSLALT